MTRLFPFLGATAALFAVAAPSGAPQEKPKDAPAFYDFNLPNIDGAMTSFAQFKGEVVLVVNVASDSNFTPQYAALETVYEKYKAQGFTILGFPCNDFAGQEPKAEADIKSFAQSTYRVTFPLFAKVGVRGDGATPLFHYLSHEASKTITGEPAWNFTKFLVDRKGELAGRFDPSVAPDDPEFLVAIEKALDGKASSPAPQREAEKSDQSRRDRSRD